MNLDYLKGVGVALVTPFDDKGEMDIPALKQVIDHLVNGGISYLVIIGTTGESVTLTDEEKKLLIRKTLEFAAGRVPVVAGFGGNDTRAIIQDLTNFDLNGISAILSVSPAYNKPTQEGIYAHYKAIAQSTDLPIILYNVPGRTSSNIKALTTLRLARDFENIVGIKEATYDLEQITELALNKPKGFYLLSGADDLIFHEMSLGFDGVISVVAHAVPAEFSEMIRLCHQNDFKSASKIHLDLYKFIWMIFEQGNPAGIKCALNCLGLCKEHVRLPLVKVNDDLRARITLEMHRLTAIHVS